MVRRILRILAYAANDGGSSVSGVYTRYLLTHNILVNIYVYIYRYIACNTIVLCLHMCYRADKSWGEQFTYTST